MHRVAAHFQATVLCCKGEDLLEPPGILEEAGNILDTPSEVVKLVHGDSATMYTNDIAAARTQLQSFEDSLGKGVLLAQLTQLETLWELIQQALTQVSSHVGSFVEFYDALAQLRNLLESAQVNLQLLEKEADDLRFAREISHEAFSVVRTVFKAISQDLDRLLWRLPTEPFRPEGPRPLDLGVVKPPIHRSASEQ